MGSQTQPVPSIAACLAGSVRIANKISAEALMVALTLTIAAAIVSTSGLIADTTRRSDLGSRLL